MKDTPSLHIALLLTVALASGCATVRAPEPPTSSHNTAVQALLDTAHAALEDGRFASATAALERALRIEPRNPVLWQELAQAHLRAGNHAQAENFAARSNTWAGGNRALLASNWQIIGEARAARGDAAGARQALERAERFR